MNCLTVSKYLSLSLYRELSVRENKIVSDHIAACKKCKKTFADYQKIHNLLDRWSEQPAGKHFFTGILEHLHPEILTPEELAVYLRVPVEEILDNINTVPHIAIGRHIRFHRETIKQWIMKSGGLKESEQSDELTEWKFLVNRTQNN